MPDTTFIVYRPPGMNRDVTIRPPPRRSNCRPAAAAAVRSRRDRITSFDPSTLRPTAYAMWSPTHTPAAAEAMTSGRCGTPDAAAKTPAVRTTASDGIIGRNPSSVVSTKTAGYSHADVIIGSTSAIRSMTRSLGTGLRPGRRSAVPLRIPLR
jgi:hypothetical protein